MSLLKLKINFNTEFDFHPLTDPVSSHCFPRSTLLVAR